MNRVQLLNLAKYSANRSFRKPITTTHCSLRKFGSSPPPPDGVKNCLSIQKQIDELKRSISSTKDWVLQVERDGIASHLEISNLKVLDICNYEKMEAMDTRVRALEALSAPKDAKAIIKARTKKTASDNIAVPALVAAGIGILKHFELWSLLMEYNDAFLKICEEFGVLLAKLVEELMK